MSGRSQVTITLGRSGHVVKRAGDVSEGEHTGHGMYVGAKRPISERLGHENHPSKNKRQRSGASRWSMSREHTKNDRHNMTNRWIGQNDLRFKLMQRSLSKQINCGFEAQNGLDSREKFSQTNQGPLQLHPRECIPGSKASSHLREIPPTRNADDLTQGNTRRNSYSAWPNGFGNTSPDRLIAVPRVVSIRSVDPPVSKPYMTTNVMDSSRPVSFMPKSAVTVQAPKPMVQLPPPSTIMPKNSFTFEGPFFTVGSLLNALGLGKYAILFQAEEVDMAALKQMSDNDIKDLGIPMGPRKKILHAIAPRSKQRHA